MSIEDLLRIYKHVISHCDYIASAHVGQTCLDIVLGNRTHKKSIVVVVFQTFATKYPDSIKGVV